MIASKYNFFFPTDNTNLFIAFNALKNGLAIFPGELVRMLQNMKKGDLLNLPEDILVQLREGGFITEDHFNEYGLMQVRRHLQQFAGNHSLGLTVAPTLACNLSCTYCFEAHQSTRMNHDVLSLLVEFIQEKIKKKGLKKFSSLWFGGEPLLCMDIIEELSEKWLKVCQEHDVSYDSYIITNGTLYTRSYAERLKALKVTGAQITIDGDKCDHDLRRPFRGGKGSFDLIFANLIEAAGVLPISLRVNVDRQNVDTALGFFMKMQEHPSLAAHIKNGKIKIHYGHVRRFTSSCRCSDDECLKDSEFWDEELKLNHYLFEKGIAAMPFPSVKAGCTATTINGYVVGPLGELYKCWNHIGVKDKVIGQLGKEIEMNSLYISYLTESFENDARCQECRVLPICMGGCVDLRINHKNGTFPRIDCSRWKYYLEESLKSFYLEWQKKQVPGTKPI